MQTRLFIALASVLAFGCGSGDPEDIATTSSSLDYNDLNRSAGDMVLYEIQARTANACHPDVGADWQRAACRAKVAPTVTYRAQGASCGDLRWLESIKLGTLDDLVEDTADYRAGITVRYVRDRVGANALWLMPVFPNNDTWSIPAGCDNLGSPYAVRDYMHARGTLDRYCIGAGRDEYSPEPCWGNGALDRVIAEAHRRGMRVLLDVALNHFGHNYLTYDYRYFDTVRERVARGEDLDRLWDFGATYDGALLYPELLDEPAELERAASNNGLHRRDLDALRVKCPSLSGDKLVRAYNAWRVAFDFERAKFACTGLLEYDVPGFYLGANTRDPSTGVGDNFSSAWADVKFLYHQQTNGRRWELVRQREYLFRILNYWVSRGVDGFRLDHTTDYHSGMSPEEWDYLISKVDYYAWRRGQGRPVWLAEEFHDQMGMNHVADIMTEGYLGDMNGRGGATKNTPRVERIIDNLGRFGGHTFVMTALETHDEARLLEGTGFNVWTGAGFWGIGAAQWSTPMLLMGQEFGDGSRLAFRKSGLVWGRFVGTDAHDPRGDDIIGLYKRMIDSRLAHENRALRAPNYRFLRSRWTNAPDDRLLAQIKWSDDGNVVFVLHNLWEQNVQQSFFIPEDVRSAARIDPGRRYRLMDAISRSQMGACRTGGELAWDFYVAMSAATRMQWLRLELCP